MPKKPPNVLLFIAVFYAVFTRKCVGKLVYRDTYSCITEQSLIMVIIPISPTPIVYIFSFKNAHIYHCPLSPPTPSDPKFWKLGLESCWKSCASSREKRNRTIIRSLVFVGAIYTQANRNSPYLLRQSVLIQFHRLKLDVKIFLPTVYRRE